MFDVDLAGGESYRESRNYRPGEIAVAADLPWGRLGLTVCYDLRFPALYRALAEAGMLVPRHPVGLHAGRPARRIGTCSIAPAPSRTAASCSRPPRAASTRTAARPIGHSLVVDPWGRILAEGGTEPGVILATIDPAEVAAARAKVPSLQHGRRFELVEPMAEPAHLHAVRRPP